MTDTPQLAATDDEPTTLQPSGAWTVANVEVLRQKRPETGRSLEMGDEQVSETIATAPYNRDLELAVIEREQVHPLVFACRRAPDGLVNVATHKRVLVSPTHWRPWSKN